MEKNRRINTDRYSNPILSVEEVRTALLYGNDIDDVMVDEPDEITRFNKYAEQMLDRVITINAPVDDVVDPETYHNIRSHDWRIPQHYKDLDVKTFLLNKCKSDAELERVNTEYKMFEERDLIPLLQFLVYIVDYMRENKLVWGVGRGSSVASYCLYLIGIHKVDSLKYDLPINEFLK